MIKQTNDKLFFYIGKPKQNNIDLQYRNDLDRCQLQSDGPTRLSCEAMKCKKKGTQQFSMYTSTISDIYIYIYISWH